MIECESFVVADWTDPGNHPGLPIAPVLEALHSSDRDRFAEIFEEHDSELLG